MVSISSVKRLFDELDEKPRKAVCFPWDHVDKNRGLLRTLRESNWRITFPTIEGTCFSKDQRPLTRAARHQHPTHRAARRANQSGRGDVRHRPRHPDQLRRHLRPFVDDFAGRDLATITTDEIDLWIMGLQTEAGEPIAARTKTNFLWGTSGNLLWKWGAEKISAGEAINAKLSGDSGRFSNEDRGDFIKLQPA
ncbi:MAG: hypothetical protein ACI8XO_003535 [Verrucomicrobiales bacterium]